MKDAVTGPLSRDMLQKLAAAPFGEARKEIQKYDPFWGVGKGEKIEFKVTCSGTVTGFAYVKAASQEEADKLADNLSEADVSWDYGTDDFEILSVEPHVEHR